MAGPQCCVPAPPSEHACTGKEEAVGSLIAYVVAPESPKAALVLVSDIFGFEAPLLRKLADKIAASGYFVAVPDFLNKDFFVKSGDSPLDSLTVWLTKHNPLDVVKDAQDVIQYVKNKGFPLVGAVGFCWGAKVVTELAKGDLLRAAVLCHPSFVTVEDIQEVKVPIAVLAAEIDQRTPPALAKQFAEVLAKNPEVESFVHVYPGVAHGWVCRYDANDEKAVANANEAHNKLLEWFGKFFHHHSS